MKGKPLLPTLRAKKRYLTYEVISEREISHEKAVKAVFDSFRNLFGAFGLGKSGLKDMDLTHKNRGILRVKPKYLDHLRSSMFMIKSIDNFRVIIHTVGVSGILRNEKRVCVEV